MHHQNSKALLDLDEGAYTLATYKSAQLQKEILALAEAAIVTRESDPLEVSKLRSICGYCAGQLSEEGWAQMLGSLVVGEAAVLPLTNEACGGLRRIHLAPRLTPHARHVSKYIDIPIPVQDQFVFWRDGALSGERAGTLREFVSVLEHVSTTSLNGHLHRNDFSKWLSTVFGDYPLADSVHQMEETYRSGQLPNALSSIVEAIRSRYDFVSRLRNYTIRLAPSH
jgi:hypothetical protein